MALPLPALTFVRMADVNPAAATIAAVLDAIYTALGAAVDYRGTAVPATHLWTISRFQNAGTTEAVYAAPPAGTPMGLTPKLMWAGRIANAGTMASPDTSLASGLQSGINKNSGAYSDWTAALPFTSGQWFGYWRAAGTGINAAATVVRAYVSQETIFLQLIQAATTQYWNYNGAIIEPYDADTTVSGETDNRLYGQIVDGSTNPVASTWLSAAHSSAFYFGHSTTAAYPHCGVFTPGAGTLIPAGRVNILTVGANANMPQTASGVWVASLMNVCKSVGDANPGGNALGTIRGLYPVGSIQSARWLRNGATDIYHFVSVDTGAAGGALMLPAVA